MVISNHIFSVASLRVRDWSPDSSRAAGGLFQQVACESETLSRWLRSQGYHLHAVSLYDKDDRVLSYVPAECLKWYAAPAFARLLLALSPSEQWVVVIRSLFGAEDVLERVRRWHTVEVLDFSPKPLLEALLCCYDSRALQQVMPYLFGDATEVFLIPEAQESPRDAFSKLLRQHPTARFSAGDEPSPPLVRTAERLHSARDTLPVPTARTGKLPYSVEPKALGCCCAR
jgi:hypothetical protein